MFVKENMRKVREENPGSPQKDIMGLVAKRYQELKVARQAEQMNENVSVDTCEVVGVGNGENGAPAVGVSRKLDFLDLTSPRG